MGLFSKKKHHTAGQVDENRLPRHIAVIMDGNGRWAKRRGLPRTAGHKVGAEVFRKIATYCKELGVEYLTVYAFSTENWKRPADEVNTIMGLLKQYMLEAIDSMERDQIRLRFLGDMSALSPELQELARRTNEISSHIQGFQSAAVGQQPQQQQAAEGGRDGQPRQRHDAHIQQGQGVRLAVGQHARRRQRYHAHQQQPVHNAQRQLPPMARTVKMQHH